MTWYIRRDIGVNHKTSSVLETLEKWVSNELQREKETDDMSPTSIVHSPPRPRRRMHTNCLAIVHGAPLSGFRADNKQIVSKALVK